MVHSYLTDTLHIIGMGNKKTFKTNVQFGPSEHCQDDCNKHRGSQDERVRRQFGPDQ